MVPWRGVAISSAVVAVLLALRRTEFSRCHLLGAFATAWMFQMVCWGIFTVFLFPQYFSPLRKLPGPKGDDHWMMGQYPRIVRQPTGVPMIEW